MSAQPTTVRSGTRITPETFSFRFDGREFLAQRGDSAAAALLAAGVRFVNRSIKYRRPRGLFAHGPEEPNALLTVGKRPAWIPNVSAPQLLVTPGMLLTSQNRWPSLRFDVASLALRPGASLWGAGFYYKTFMWPSWRTYESLVRRLAGLGYAPEECELPRARVEHLAADVLVAGAGAAGLMAALVAARGGARVVLCEREPVLGGELEFECALIDGLAALDWVARTRRELDALGAVILTHTAVISTGHGLATAHGQPAGMPGADTLYKIYAPVLINAMGAVERGIAFVDNDLPGIMLCGAADRLLARYGVSPGRNVVLFGNNDRLYATARRLIDSGTKVAAVIDTRLNPSSAARAAVSAAGVECMTGHVVVAASGHPELARVIVAPRDAPASTRTVACDALLVSGGWAPAVQAGLQQGGAARYAPEVAAFVPEDQPDWRLCCGAAAGRFDLSSTLTDAVATGLAATRDAPDATPTAPAVHGDDGAPLLEPYWRSPASLAGEKRQFVDLQNDVTVADLRQALAEGVCDIEHVKRYTTLGVGTEQGRTGGTLGAAILAELRGEPLSTVGISRSRGPYQPVPMMTLSGLRVDFGLRPERRTPLHELHVAAGAEMELMSGWMRPRYYAANGADPMVASVVEAARVRAHGGICDGSTLGKLEIAGPDAAAFLDGLYLSPASTILPGRSRYAALLREDGIVLDDGLLLRLTTDRFLATTSSSHTQHVLAHLEFYRDTAEPRPRVAITDATEAWSVIVVAGPQSRTVLHEVLGAAWSSAVSSTGHMGFSEGTWNGARLRLLRASFSGELAFEIHSQPAVAPELWTRLSAGGLAPFGLEALDVLRVEKGYLTTSELNGQTSPQDVLMDRMLKAPTQPVGKALLARQAFTAADRPILVGVRAADGRAKLLGGTQITAPATPAVSLGYITSAVFSPQLNEWIGLALVSRRFCAPGTELLARDPLRHGDCKVRVTSPVHFDPDGERLRA